MVATVKNMAKKASQLFASRRFGRSRNWPAGVLNQLETVYHLRPAEMSRLGYIRRNFGRNNRNTSLYIYDTMLASDKRIKIKKTEDIFHAPELLLFRGGITDKGEIRIARVDRIQNN